MRRALAITLALFALVGVVAWIRYAPPSPLPASAAVERFSAMRAREVQARFVGDGATRYVGTPGNARGRGVIVAELEKSGWTVETQTARFCSYHGSCAPIANVVAQLPGREPSLPGVLLTAHHDSVPVSPGASDDGLGTATVLETARALAEGPRPRRTVVVVLTDAEEAGLLGADAFVRGHPLAGQMRATINVDARGSRGPSQMFETSRGNAWLVALMSDRLERPVTTSLFYEVYKRMPNDTDFSITKTIASGINFANTAGMEHYHTPLDGLDTSNPGTLQHHGDHLLSMARAFAESDLGGPGAEGRGDSVWFDVLALGIVHWPERWSMLLALVGLTLILGQAFRARVFERGLVVFPAVLVPGLAAAALAGWLLHAIGALPALFVAHPLPALTAIHAATAAVVLGGGLFVARRSTPRALWAGTWIGWGVLGAVTATIAPGMSYLFIVPTLVAALCGSFSLAVACVAPAVVASLLLLALVSGIHDALGFAVAPVTALPTLLLTTTLAPLLVDVPGRLRRLVPASLGALAVVAAIAATIVPKFTAGAPQRVNVVFRQDDTSARVFVDTTWGPAAWGAAPPAMLDAIGGPLRTGESALPWTMASLSAETPRLDLPPPSAEILSVEDAGDRRHVRVRLRSRRHAPALSLLLPAGRHVEVKVEGRFASTRPLGTGSALALLAVPDEGVIVDLESPSTGPIPVRLLDRSFGVPPGSRAEAAVRVRPAEAVPFQDGDLTVVLTSLSL